MQRLLKNWKVIAYFAGLIAVGSTGNAWIAALYAFAGIGWVVYWLYANQSEFAGRKKAGSFVDEDFDEVSSTANGRWDPTHPMSPFNNSYFDHT
ncbi:hypothetical protein ABLN87_20850 [Ruegeria sp. SCPT10]|uniref:hypothetical protein n=1 Tax=Ruegeria sp. SCP10 TaxID=3141377 RepID=UPI003335445B